MMNLQLKLNRIPSARTAANKRFIADVYSFSQHSGKPLLAAAFRHLAFEPIIFFIVK
jgi:hypothetical protein